MKTFLFILLAIVVLLVLITVHEFGHYCAGKLFHFKINEFSIGFGPAIYKRTKKDGEIFAIRALPLGGYCAFEGEGEAGNENPGAFNTMPAWQRVIVLVAGVTFNFIFGIITAAIYLMVAGYSVPKVTQTISQQSVTTAGFEKGDIIVAVDGKYLEAYRTFNSLISGYEADEDFTVTVNRDGEIIDITTKKQAFPAYYFVSYDEGLNNLVYKFDLGEYKHLSNSEFEALKESISSAPTLIETGENVGKGLAIKNAFATYFYKSGDEYKLVDDDFINLILNGNKEAGIYASVTYVKPGTAIGIIQTTELQKYGFFEALGKAWPFCFYLCGLILNALGGLFTGATALKDMGGTVTAVSQMATISQMGINYFLLLLPLLSMNLALFNILPIPSLDGARIVFVFIEMIFRKPVNRKVEAWIHTIGLFLLLGLVLFFDIYHFAVAAKLLL